MPPDSDTHRIDTRPPLIALMGPTASGKTAVAMAWAERFGAQLVSVDSALVYRRLDIGSAKPDAAMQARAPHRLIDIRDPHEVYSAADFRADALREVAQITDAGGLPVLVGGTGLYFHALLHGFSSMPQADTAVRAAIEADALSRGWPALHDELAAVDPAAAARIGRNDIQRIQRALEVWRISGRAISDWQSHAARSPLPWRVLKLVIAPDDRAVLHARIALRFDQMLAGGLIEEVRGLREDMRLHPALPAMRAVGYRQTLEFLDGVGTLADLRQRGVAATRQLAKRQLTWLRGELDARWFDPETQRGELDRSVEMFVGASDVATGE
jgi:tRNA dimethylallyltransferase